MNKSLRFSLCWAVLSPLCGSMVIIQVMESLGVLQELREAGAVDGDRVLVGEREIVVSEPPEYLS